MSQNWIIVISFLYLGVLFAIAYWGEKRSAKNRSLVNNPYVYALSIAVYCTAWTYYGSVGRAYFGGIDFLAIYIGPTLAMPLWFVVMRKIIRICKVQRLTSIADFISTRYDKSLSLGIMVTVFSVLGIVPYIALQIKALDFGLNIVSDDGTLNAIGNDGGILRDSAFYLAIGLGLFTIIYGTRKADVTERHEGMVTAIAFESVLKLVAFIALGVFVCFIVFNSPADIFTAAAAHVELKKLFTFSSNVHYLEWLAISLLSMFAIVLLPRQFQVAVVENVNEKHLEKAIWLFPLYLFLINVFVLPIAFGGATVFAGQNVNPDTFVLAIPLYFNQDWLLVLVYLGGFAAATSMLIVSSIALSTMISNQLIMPVFLKLDRASRYLNNNVGKRILFIRRVSIVIIILLAYGYYRYVVEGFSLINIGLISFVAVAQFAPSVFGGIFWKGGTKLGAKVGLILGFLFWFYLLVMPTIPGLEQEDNIFQLAKMIALYHSGQSVIINALFWSLFTNTFAYILFSFWQEKSSRELNQAEIFVDIFQYSQFYERSVAWKGTVYVKDIENILSNFVSIPRAKKIIREFAEKQALTLQEDSLANAELVTYVESLLAGVIGSVSARIMMSSLVKEDEISLDEVFDILKESQQLLNINRELKEKSTELKQVSDKLWAANEKLRKNDELKDDFISTVTHEMRTPITAIKAFGEILQDNPDISENEKKQFLLTIVKEAERMNRLINHVLEMDRFDSGQEKLNFEAIDMKTVIDDASDSLQQLIKDKEIVLIKDIQKQALYVNADKDRMVQVMLNLLGNAIKFVPLKSGKIVISAYYLDGDIKVNVIDNGKGIENENPGMLFDKFYQAKNQTTKKPEGSGLGLAITKKIIDHHQGKIWFDTTVKSGVKISFTLPALSKNKFNKED